MRCRSTGCARRSGAARIRRRRWQKAAAEWDADHPAARRRGAEGGLSGVPADPRLLRRPHDREARAGGAHHLSAFESRSARATARARHASSSGRRKRRRADSSELSRDVMGQAATASPLPSARREPAGRRFGLGRSPFQMADGRAGGAADPGLLDLPDAVLALGRFRQLRFPDSRPRLRRAPEFPRSSTTRCAWSSLGLTIALSVTVVAHRVRARPGAGARDGEDVPRPRARHVDPDHSAVHQPGDRRPVLGALPAAALRSRRLSAEPAARPAGRDQLGRRGPLGLYLHRHRRCLAVDAVHVRHPARRARGDPAASLRGGRARRGRRPADLLLRDAAAAGADHPAGGHASGCSTRSSSSTSSSC